MLATDVGGTRIQLSVFYHFLSFQLTMKMIRERLLLMCDWLIGN